MRKNRPDTTPLRLVPMLRDADPRSLVALAPHTDVVRVRAGRDEHRRHLRRDRGPAFRAVTYLQAS